MKARRQFLIAGGAGLGLLAARPASLAEQPVKVHRIGFLGTGTAAGWANWIEALRAGLRQLGYVEGRNIIIEFRWADGNYERARALAADLVRLPVDILVTHGVPGTRAAKDATTTIPVVVAVVGEIVATGLVASLARPGGNITGSSFFVPELNAKRLELLRETLPRMRRVAALINSDNPAMSPIIQAMEPAAASLKLELQQYGVRGPEQFDGVVASMAKRVDAVVVVEDAMINVHIKAIAELAAGRRLPTAGFTELAQAGGLMAYGANFSEMYRRVAYFVDRILKGTKPGDLPIELPTKFELVINMKTAKALGITIPQPIVVRADRVIE